MVSNLRKRGFDVWIHCCCRGLPGDDGPPADVVVTRYFKQRRYAGSKDRRAVRELVFRAIRRSAERPESGRSAVLGLAEDDPTLLEHFGQPRGPATAGRCGRRTVVCPPTTNTPS